MPRTSGHTTHHHSGTWGWVAGMEPRGRADEDVSVRILTKAAAAASMAGSARRQIPLSRYHISCRTCATMAKVTAAEPALAKRAAKDGTDACREAGMRSCCGTAVEQV